MERPNQLESIPYPWLLRLPHVDLIDTTTRAITASVERNVLEHVLAQLADTLPEPLFPLLKINLDRAEGLVRIMVQKRIRWDTWPVDTGPVVRARIREELDRFWNDADLSQAGALRALTNIGVIVEHDRDTDLQPTTAGPSDSGDHVG